MTEFILRRLLQTILVLIVMTVLVFFGVHVIGNPADLFASSECTRACLAEIEANLGLDRPVWQQYLIFLGNIAQGDLGRSFQFGVPAMSLIWERFPATLELALASVVLAVAVGTSVIAVGLILILTFSVRLGWFPAIGRGDTVELFGVPFSFLTLDGLRHLAMPAVTLSLLMMSMVIRLTRAGLREVMTSDYIRFARANGVPERRIIGWHAMKNILIPIVTVLGMELGGVIAFAVVTESIFSWPGVGKMLIDAITVLDRPLIVAYLIFVVTMFVILNLVIDILYSLLDPRMRPGAGSA